MTTSDQLIAAIAENPSDHLAYLVVADLLEEEGNFRLAVAYRWCGENKQLPGKSKYGSDNPYFFCGYQLTPSLNQFFTRRIHRLQGGYADCSFVGIMIALATAIEECGL